MPNIELVNLSCGGCFASVEETNHGGAFDSFTINYNGTDSALITNGVNYTSAGIKAAIEAIAGWPAGATVTVANFGGGGSPSVNGFQVTFGGTLALTNLPALLSLTNLSAGASGFFGETDKGGPVDNQGGIITPTGNAIPVVTAPDSVHDPAADAVRPHRQRDRRRRRHHALQLGTKRPWRLNRHIASDMTPNSTGRCSQCSPKSGGSHRSA